MRIYIGCGLTHVPRDLFVEYTSFIYSLARTLEATHDVQYALRDSDPQLAMKELGERARLCYLWDRQMVENAESMIADVSFPSTGLGIELQIAESRNTPLVLCYRDWGSNRAKTITYETPDQTRHQLQIGTGFASLMVMGISNVFKTIQYSNASEGIQQVVASISLLDRR